MVKNPINEKDTFEVKAHLKPVAFQVECPACAHEWDAGKVEEDFAGGFEAVDGDQFIKCHCGALITVLPVKVRP